MHVTQVSVFLQNKPGHLEKVLKFLHEKSINIITLTIAETSDYGILRLITNDPEEAVAVLKAHQVSCSTTRVLAIALDDTPGSLHLAVQTFSRCNLNIEYMYAFSEKRDGRAIMIFRFEDADQARDVLVREGFQVLSNMDVVE